MRTIIIWLVLWITLPVFPEPGVAVIYSPRQAPLATETRRLLELLVKQNELADHQFSLRMVDVSTPAGRRFRADYQLTDADLPALACYDREGNRIRLRSLVRAYREPLVAAETAFARIQQEEPRLVASSRLTSGLPASLTILSQGPPVAVSLDGVALGVTPVTVEALTGRRRLTGSAPGWRAVDLEFQAENRMQVVIQPVRQEVRVGLGEVTADGYLVGRGFDSLPFPTGGVELNGGDYARQLQENLALVTSGWDCALNLDVNAWERRVKAELTIVDREGRPLQSLVAERAMPVFTLDEEGSARVRAAQLVDELAARAAQWIRDHVQAGPLSAEEQRARVELRVLD